MKNLLFLLFAFAVTTHAALSQEAKAPMVPGFGGVYEIPQADKLPDPSLQYKIVVDATAGSSQPEELNPALYRLARMLNLHALSGVPQANITVVAVIHSKATPVVLSNEAYRKHFGNNNPNADIIRTLTEAGVEIYVCGQSLIARGYAGDTLHPDIRQSISAMTILTEYQLKGYAMLAF